MMLRRLRRLAGTRTVHPQGPHPSGTRNVHPQGPHRTAKRFSLLAVFAICAGLAGLAGPACAGLTFYDSFESRPAGQSVNGTLPESGTDPYAVRGTGSVVTATRGGNMTIDLNGLAFTNGLILYGPALGAERWLRYDMPGSDAGYAVLIPQVRTGAETTGVALPAVWPAGQYPDTDQWRTVNTRFTNNTGGTTSPAVLDLGAAYPNTQRNIPYHMEIHWRVDTATQATLEVRTWNGDTPPAFSSAARSVYTLQSGTWPASARAALTNVAGHSYLSALALYDATPGETNLVPAADPRISYSGRWATVADTERHTSSAGSRFRFVATGDKCYLRVRGTGDVATAPPLNIRVDGGVWTRVEPGSASDHAIRVYDGDLPSGAHAVEVLVSAATPGDPWATTLSRFMLQGISVAPTATVSPLPYPARKVAFLGDDTSTGQMVLSSPLNAGANGRNEARLAAPTLVADWLGVESLNVSTPGLGFLAPAGAATALPFLQNTLQGVPWQTSLAPDAIIVNLGSNDNPVATYPDAALRTAAENYLRAVRTKFPFARIFMLRPFSGSREAVLKAAFDGVADRNSAWVDTTGWLDLTTGRDTTDGTHLNVSGNVKYAQNVIALLSAYFSTLPTAEITAPQANANVQGLVAVRGNALGYSFTGYRLEVGRGDAPTAWTLLADAATPVYDNVLGQWDTAGLAGGRYTLRLTVIANEKIAINTLTVNLTVTGKAGDVDGNGLVNILDVTQALKVAGGIAALGPDRLPFADIAPAGAPDSRVNVVDAIAILRLTQAAP